MTDFSSILLIHTLRATVDCLRESPAIDPAHPGIVEFRRVLEQAIAQRLPGNEPSTLAAAPR